MRKTVFLRHNNITITVPLSFSASSKPVASSKLTKPNPLDLPVSRSRITCAVNKNKQQKFHKFSFSAILYKCEVAEAHKE